MANEEKVHYLTVEHKHKDGTTGRDVFVTDRIATLNNDTGREYNLPKAQDILRGEAAPDQGTGLLRDSQVHAERRREMSNESVTITEDVSTAVSSPVVAKIKTQARTASTKASANEPQFALYVRNVNVEFPRSHTRPNCPFNCSYDRYSDWGKGWGRGSAGTSAGLIAHEFPEQRDTTRVFLNRLRVRCESMDHYLAFDPLTGAVFTANAAMAHIMQTIRSNSASLDDVRHAITLVGPFLGLA